MQRTLNEGTTQKLHLGISKSSNKLLNLKISRCNVMLSHLNISKKKTMLIFVMELYVNDSRSPIAQRVKLHRKKCSTLQFAYLDLVETTIQGQQNHISSDGTEFRSPLLSCGILGVCMRISAASAFVNMLLRSCYDSYEYMFRIAIVCVCCSYAQIVFTVHKQTHATQTHSTRCDHSVRVPFVCGCARSATFFLT